MATRFTPSLPQPQAIKIYFIALNCIGGTHLHSQPVNISCRTFTKNILDWDYTCKIMPDVRNFFSGTKKKFGSHDFVLFVSMDFVVRQVWHKNTNITYIQNKKYWFRGPTNLEFVWKNNICLSIRSRQFLLFQDIQICLYMKNKKSGREMQFK